MPLGLDKNKNFRIVLMSDKKKTEEIQPAFLFKHITGNEWFELATLDDQMQAIKGSVEAGEHTFKTVSKFLMGWENMFGLEGEAIEYDPDKLKGIINVIEAQELIQRLLRGRPDFTTSETSGSLSD